MAGHVWTKVFLDYLQASHIPLPSQFLKTACIGQTGTPRASIVPTSSLGRTRRSSVTSCTSPWTSIPCTPSASLQVKTKKLNKKKKEVSSNELDLSLVMWLLVPLENLPRICHRYINSGQGRPELALSWELVAPSAGHFGGNTIRAHLAFFFLRIQAFIEHLLCVRY